MKKATNKTTRTTRTTRTKPLHGGKLLTTTLQALTELYPLDPTSPGLVMAYVHNKGFYCSIVRYEGPSQPGVENKQVLTNAFASSIEEAFRQCLLNWHSRTPKASELLRQVRQARLLDVDFDQMDDSMD